jgi:hypothetical protein
MRGECRVRPRPYPHARMLPLFAATIFLGAFLLFLVQPMAAKTMLPLLGGSPAVWNACMLFFQAALLGGYLYAHLLSHRLGRRAQAALHTAVVAAAALALPAAALPRGWSPIGHAPVLWLLAALAVSVGAPFLVLATTGPLVQGWFGRTGHRSAKDPYFLYAASNAGSLLALLAYPTLVEPWLTLSGQRLAWSIGYGVFAVLVISCGIVMAQRPATAMDRTSKAVPAPPPHIDVRTRLRWVLLAFVPSSLMLGATQYISTDVAAVPLLWVLPLSLYLLTFIIAFGRPPAGLIRWSSRVLPIAAVGVIGSMLFGVIRPVWPVAVIHFSALFVGALLCHSRLAAERPDPRRLTEFYLLVAVGGVLGGLFNALLAPSVFSSVAEYPIAIVLACALRPRTSTRPRTNADLLIDAGFAAAVFCVTGAAAWAEGRMGTDRAWLGELVKLGIPGALCLTLVVWPLRFALGIGAFVVAGQMVGGLGYRVLYRDRTFFGVYRVLEDSSGSWHWLVHGTTRHGTQSRDPDLAPEPTAYYHRHGPIGDVFAMAGEPGFRHVGVVGLGAGAMAAYGWPRDDGGTVTFFEIDPVMERIARDPRLFTYLRDSRASVNVIIGDARLRIAEAAAGSLDVLVLDAFTSDAVPVHLLTKEAVELYLTKMSEHGVLAFHISSRYLDLGPPLGAIARDLGLVAYERSDNDSYEFEEREGKTSSTWLIMARDEASVGRLASDPRWVRYSAGPGTPAWSDDYSNILGVFRWSQRN